MSPVGAPWNGGDQANVRKKDGVILDAIQGVVHLTEWQSVQLELQLHLRARPHSGCCFINGRDVKLLSHRLWLHNIQNTIQNTTDHMLFYQLILDVLLVSSQLHCGINQDKYLRNLGCTHKN